MSSVHRNTTLYMMEEIVWKLTPFRAILSCYPPPRPHIQQAYSATKLSDYISFTMVVTHISQN